MAQHKVVTLAEVERYIAEHPDDWAGDVFPAGTFQKEAYLNATQDQLADPEPQKANAEACARWGLSAAEWAEQMRAVARARAHDARLDLIKKGITPSL